MVTEFAPQLKLLHYPEHVSRFVAGDWKSPPVNVEISPTNECPAKCPWCWYVEGAYKQKHSKDELDYDLLCDSLYDMRDMGVKAITWTGGGDPSVYSSIDNAIDVAHGLDLHQGIFTNAYRPLRSPEKLDWIRVTVTEKFTVTKHVARYAKATKTGVNFNLCAENEQHLRPMVEAAREAGCAYFQVRPALADRWDLQKWVTKPEWLKQFATPEFRIVLTDYKWLHYMQPHGYPMCHGHRFVPFLWHNGDLSVCAYHFGKPEFTFGNLVDGGFRTVWESGRRQQMLEAGIAVIPECQHCCKLEEINRPLAALASDTVMVEDIAFL